MSSSISFSVNINDEKFFYNNFFDENDEKSRLFEDVEKDLIEKLEVSNILYNTYLNIKFNKKRNYQNFSEV